jgi:hypothetical protein
VRMGDERDQGRFHGTGAQVSAESPRPLIRERRERRRLTPI